MKILTILLVSLLILAAPVLALAQSVPDGAWAGVTVVLSDGWRYRDITAYLDAKGAGLWVLRQDGAERLVAIDRISRIFGPDGDEVTDRVLGGLPGPQVQAAAPVVTPPPVQDDDRVGWDGAVISDQPVVQLKPFKIALTLEGGYGLPTGQWYDGLDPSWSAGTRLRIGTVNRSYLGFGFRYQDYGIDLPQGAGDEFSVEAHTLIYDLTFGWMSPAASNGTMTYFELGAALLRNETNVVYGDENYRYTDGHGAFLVRGGLMLPVSRASSLDLGFSWAYKGQIFNDGGEPGGSLIALHLGMTWLN